MEYPFVLVLSPSSSLCHSPPHWQFSMRSREAEMSMALSYTVQQLLQRQCVINIIFLLHPTRSIIPHSMKKINSV